MAFLMLLVFLYRVAEIIRDRLSTLDSALNTRSQVHAGTQDATRYLADVRDELRLVSKGIGPSVQEAEMALQQYEVRIAIIFSSIAHISRSVLMKV